MRSMTIGAALALAAMIVPVASQAADTAIGTVSSGSSALVARDGKVMPAVAGMRGASECRRSVARRNLPR